MIFVIDTWKNSRFIKQIVCKLFMKNVKRENHVKKQKKCPVTSIQ
jgi:hypothetical protein